ncbi:hypothetical protein MYCTH_2308340 [Thermothelomyces thermophilus ATCC 42464]|uniref:Uncharacterized protein n=1 Tax=Thermothelomyces thermophilus (strain ATCC 42464 / BCRC 31852 / DSM 1799) TaxID=573729 RepID=G2QJP5_THET4|nr:uncharacterized protein MYCTH_2308340 [Thermothelomyces thermophilus ATCC 42464]AEO59802.1 hypothetical protein MYCTH_2308340 [Thermothelomyces thermophilus ATCC 42464]
MTSLLPLIQDILPMILPASVTVTKAADILPGETGSSETAAATPGVRVISRNAVVGKTDKMCTSILILKPNSSSSVRHHGEQGTCLSLSRHLSYVCTYPQGCAQPSEATPSKPPWEETIIYAVSGKGAILSQPTGDDEEPERHDLDPGDFAFIPAWTEHQAVNDSEVDWHLVIIRSGSHPVEVNLTGWGGAEIKEPPRQ